MLWEWTGVCYGSGQVYAMGEERCMLWERTGVCYGRGQVYVMGEDRCMLWERTGVPSPKQKHNKKNNLLKLGSYV